MNQKVLVGTGRKLVTLTDKHYKAAGGEASIYVNGNVAYKIFHDPKKLLPPQKVTELLKIGNPQVVLPHDLLFDGTTGEAIGYASHYVDDAVPLARLFTRTFKDENNISPEMIADLVKFNQRIVSDVHSAHCLIVDLNELNVLVKVNSALEPWFIDTNSYATPSFHATAIMDSVRDRRVSKLSGGQLHYSPDMLSDWFSWGVLSFWLYTNIHPYRGSHPNYKPRDKGKQMDDGISVFHKGVKLPPSVNNFNTIPKRHLDWFKAVFLKNERSIPPLADSSVPLAVPPAFITVNSTSQINVKEMSAYTSPIVGVFYVMGTTYVVTKTHICFGKREIPIPGKGKKVMITAANDGTPVAAVLSGTKVSFVELNRATEIGTITSNGMFARNDVIYTVANGRLVENSFTTLAGRIVHRTNEIENISQFTAVVHDGCILQDLLGKKYLTLPYAKGRSFSKYLPQLDGFRVIDAKSDKNVTVILAERNGVYHRFIVMFDSKFLGFDVREVKDVAFDTINFTVLNNGTCILLSAPTELEMFTTNKQIETLSDPPFDSTMRLFSTPDGAFFVNGNSVHQIKRK